MMESGINADLIKNIDGIVSNVRNMFRLMGKNISHDYLHLT